MRDKIRDPQAAARSEAAVTFGEHGLPLGIVAQMMEHGSGHDHIEGGFAQLNLPDVALHGPHRSPRRRSHAFDRAIEHGPAEVQERDVEVGQTVEQLECVVARAAADVEDARRAGRNRGRARRDQLQRDWRVHRRRLSRLQGGKPFDVGVETGANLVDAGLMGHYRSGCCCRSCHTS